MPGLGVREGNLLIIKSKVQTARKTYDCDDCGKPILKGYRYRYMFGAPDKNDKPYGLRLCGNCTDLEEGNDA
jgi:hypothetical protein